MAIHFVFTQLDISFPVDNNRSHQCWSRSSLCPTYVLNYLFAPCGCLSIYRFVHCGFCFWLLRRVSFHFTSICVWWHRPLLGHPVAACFLFSSAADDAIPCHTGHWRCSINFERPRKTICAMGAYQGYQVRCEVVLSLQTMKFSFV